MNSAPTDFLRALRRRDPLRADGRTDALRLLDGAGDGAAFAGLYVDDFAGRWLIQTSRPGQEPPAFLRDLLASTEPHAPRSLHWKRLDARDQHQRPPVHWAGEAVDAAFAVRENSLLYHIDFQGGYSQGIFLDQRGNRLALRQRMRPGMAVLNCFAYTCAFSVAAAAAGVRTTSVDLSRRSLDWGKENFRLNGLDPDAPEVHHFLAGDVFDWLTRLDRQGRRYDAVVLDPPTFSRDRKGKVFRVGDNFGELAALAAGLLTPGGFLLCSSNSRELTTPNFQRMILAALPGSRRWRTFPAPMPPDFTGEHYLQACWIEATSRP